MLESDQLEEPDFDRILEMQDFFPKIFLQPQEIRLDREQGIKVVNRDKSHPDRTTEEEISIKSTVMQQILKQMQLIQQDTVYYLYSDTRRKEGQSWPSPKHMLKATIKGIQESNRDFLEQAGIMSHQIIVVVIFDGLEHLNSSKDQTENMISFFNEIDIKNGFRQRSNSMTLDDFLKELQLNKFDPNALPEDRLTQVNLFTQEQLQELQPKLFQNQYKQYTRTKKLLGQIQGLLKVQELRLELLPADVVRKYEQLCVNFCAQNGYWFQTQEEIQQYLSGRKNIRDKLVYQALSQVAALCRRYLESRQDKVLLYPVRMEKNDLSNPRQKQNAEEQFSSLIHQSQRPDYNYLFLCVKHRNSGKLNSHMLFFEGFCRLFDPEYCMLTDVGVKPQGDAIFRMFKHMELHPKCGGVCGYMSLKIENPSDDLGYRLDGYEEDQVDCLTRCLNYLVSIQRAQQFEYHYAHMLDKPFQSCFNYIHVLPGAFSGYRWKALKSVRYKPKSDHHDDKLQLQSERYTARSDSSDEEEESETILKRYLKTCLQDKLDLSLQDSNMYLAEDRILCLGIHALQYDLHYLPDVESSVDPVTSLTKLLGQRRRWINGSWFAFNYVREHSHQSNSWLFLIQLLYYSFVQKLQWIGPALFYLAMNMTLISFITNNVVPAIQDFFRLKQNFQLYNYNILYIFNIRQMLLSIPDIFNFAYILAVLSVLLWSTMVNHNDRRFKVIYYGASTLLGIYGILVLALLIFNVVEIIQQTQSNPIDDSQQFVIPLIYLRALILFVIVGFALPVLWTFSFRKSVEMLTSLISYIYFSPTYINLLQIFAFARIDDLSWGTKGLDSDQQHLREWQRRKYIFVLQYLGSNTVLAYLLVQLSKFDLTKNILILASSALVVFLLAFRLIFAAIYLLKYYISRACGGLPSEYVSQNRAHGYKVYNALRLIELRIKEVQKERTKRKKHEQFRTLASATSLILSKALSNFGKRIRNKVAKHIVTNNLLPRKELMDPFKKRLKLKKSKNSKASIQPIEEVDQKSQSQEKRLSSDSMREANETGNEVKEAKENQESRSDKRQIKKILQSIRQRYKSKIKSVNK